MKYDRSKGHRPETSAPPKTPRRRVASTLAPDLYENGVFQEFLRDFAKK